MENHIDSFSSVCASTADLDPSDASAVTDGADRPAIVKPVLLIILLITCIVYWARSNRSSLPGPRGVPLLGCIPYLLRNPVEKLKEYTDKYGPIFEMKIGPTSAIMLNSIEAVREAYVTKGSIFNNRPQFFAKLIGVEALGLVMLEPGKFHAEQRRMLNKVVNNLGSDAFDRYAKTHITTLKHTLRDSQGSPLPIVPHINKMIFSSVGQFIFGADIDIDHIRHLVDGNLSANPVLTLSGKLIPNFIKKRLTKYDMDLSSNFQKSLRKILQLVQEHKGLLKSRNCKDLVSGYLHIYDTMFQDHKMSGKSGSPFVDEAKSTDDMQLAMIMLDCYQAGVEATSAQAKWAFYYLAKNPHVQVKIQEEMERVIGQDTTPLITHKNHHPYTLASLCEVQRLRPAAPLGAPHASVAEETLCGHTIPAGTMLLTNIWSVHMDPKHWDSPEEFRPERFLDTDGKLTRPDSFLPFSIGSRFCPGKEVARNMIFLLITNILQDFNLTLAEDQIYDLGHQAINWAPQDFKVTATARQRRHASTHEQ